MIHNNTNIRIKSHIIQTQTDSSRRNPHCNGTKSPQALMHILSDGLNVQSATGLKSTTTKTSELDPTLFGPNKFQRAAPQPKTTNQALLDRIGKS